MARRKEGGHAKTAGEGLDHRSGGVADLTGAIKERVSPAVQIWLDLITDVIVEKVIKEQRAKWEEAQLDASGEEKRPAGRQPRRGWRIKNRLPAIKIGRAVRFDRQSLDRWMERHRERVPRLAAEDDA